MHISNLNLVVPSVFKHEMKCLHSTSSHEIVTSQIVGIHTQGRHEYYKDYIITVDDLATYGDRKSAPIKSINPEIIFQD